MGSGGFHGPGHEVFRLDIEVKTPRLFGFPPDLCMDYWTNEDGSCNYNTVESWDETERGFYVLFSTPGATSYHITGPHLPSPAPPPWGEITVSPEVPAALLGASELVVTVFMYRQYPRECWIVVDEDTGSESKECTDGYGGNNVSLRSISLETRANSLAGDGPPVERPRLFGSDDVWMADQEPFEQMPCIEIEQTANVVGDLENIKNLWDQYTLGAVPCEGEAIPSLSNIPLSHLPGGYCSPESGGRLGSEPRKHSMPFGEPRPISQAEPESCRRPGRDGGDYPGV